MSGRKPWHRELTSNSDQPVPKEKDEIPLFSFSPSSFFFFFHAVQMSCSVQLQVVAHRQLNTGVVFEVRVRVMVQVIVLFFVFALSDDGVHIPTKQTLERSPRGSPHSCVPVSSSLHRQHESRFYADNKSQGDGHQAARMSGIQAV